MRRRPRARDAGTMAVRVGVADDSFLIREALTRLLGDSRRDRARRRVRGRRGAGGGGRHLPPRRRPRRHPDATDDDRRGHSPGGPAAQDPSGGRRHRDERPLPTRPMRSRCWRGARRAARTCSRTASTAAHSCWRRSRPSLGADRSSTPRWSRHWCMGARGRCASPLDVLTPREREILVEMARGASNAAIAETPGPDQARRREAHQRGLREARPAALRRRQPSRARGPPVPRAHGPRSSYARHDLTRAGWIATMRPRGTHVQSSPGSDVALRSAAFARPRARARRPPRPAVVQTALAWEQGLPRRPASPSRTAPTSQHPALQGVLYGVLIAAMTTVACVALHRGIERRLWLVLLTLALYSATTLDTLADARPRCPRADRMGRGARGRRLHPAVLPGGPAPRSGGTRGRHRDSAGSGPRLGRPPRHGRAPARVHAVGDAATANARATRSGSWAAARPWATRWRWPRGPDRRGAHRRRRGADRSA